MVTVGETTAFPEMPEAVKPVPVQEVALVLLQVRVDDPPEAMEAGEAEREAVGEETVAPVPVSAIDLVVLEVVSRNESAPVRVPAMVGVNVMLKVQD